jgi:hypothetical protein
MAVPATGCAKHAPEAASNAATMSARMGADVRAQPDSKTYANAGANQQAAGLACGTGFAKSSPFILFFRTA